MKRDTFFKYFFALFVSVVIIYFLLTKVDIKSIFSFLIKMDLKYLCLAFFVYYLGIIFRVIRFSYLLQNKIPFFTLHKISIYHNFFTSVLPSATGELSYIYMVNKTGKVTISKNISSLFIARIFDFVSFFIIMLFGYLYLKNELPANITSLFLIIVFLLAIISICMTILVLDIFNVRFLGFIKKIIKALKLDKIKYIRILTVKFEKFVKTESNLDKKVIFFSIVVSFLVWIAATLSNYYIFLATGIEFSIIKILFAIALLKFMSLLPIQGLAGFGTSEGLWALIFVQLGLSLENSILTGFAAHLVSLLFICMLALFIFAFNFFSSKN
ncbi:MAG: lysylphosphatidylglycerol synthase transmembrane domain-containing protein [archaeon]